MGVVGRAVASETIRRKIRALPQYPAAKQLAAFAALPEEADIWPLLEDRWEKQAAVALPRITSFSRREMISIRLKAKTIWNWGQKKSGNQKNFSPS